MHLIHNERVKLTAGYLNGLSVAFLAAGGLAPFVTLTSSGSTSERIPVVIYMMLGCSVTSAILHYGARRFLEGLRDE